MCEFNSPSYLLLLRLNVIFYMQIFPLYALLFALSLRSLYINAVTAVYIRLEILPDVVGRPAP